MADQPCQAPRLPQLAAPDAIAQKDGCGLAFTVMPCQPLNDLGLQVALPGNLIQAKGIDKRTETIVALRKLLHKGLIHHPLSDQLLRHTHGKPSVTSRSGHDMRMSQRRRPRPDRVDKHDMGAPFPRLPQDGNDMDTCFAGVFSPDEDGPAVQQVFRVIAETGTHVCLLCRHDRSGTEGAALDRDLPEKQKAPLHKVFGGSP